MIENKSPKSNDHRSSNIVGFFMCLEFLIAVIVGVGVLVVKYFF